MQKRKSAMWWLTAVATVAALVMPVSSAPAAEFWLWADQTTMTMPDAAVITMWGFGLDGDGNFATTGDYTVSVPGPVLDIPPGDTSLTIHLMNNLPDPVSLCITGLALTNNTGPVWTDWPNDTNTWTGSRPTTPPWDLDARVRSFAHETPAAGGPIDYIWDVDGRSGTFLLTSGTNPAKQNEMGLYLAVTKNAAANQAYGDPATAYDSQIVLLFSEIDPAIHAAVAAGQYGPYLGAPPMPAGWITSGVNHVARYFLINGQAYDQAHPELSTYGGAAGSTILLRILNGGQETASPFVQGGTYLTLIAEDGHPLTHAKQQVSVELPAGSNVDALLNPTSVASIPIYDRGLRLTNNGQYPGGALAFLSIVPGPPVVDIKVNGSDGPISIITGVNAAVTISLDPGNLAGTDVDVFALARNLTTGDRYWWTGGLTWVQQIPPIAASTGAIPSIGMMEIRNTTLPVGNWRFYFGFDTVPNGSLNQGAAIIDIVRVHSITP